MAIIVHEHKYDPSTDIFSRRVIGILDFFSMTYDHADDGQKDEMLQIINDAEAKLSKINDLVY